MTVTVPPQIRARGGIKSTVEHAYPGLDGRTVLITGTTSGIGYAATVALARRGAAVHFLARDHGPG